MSRQGLLSGNYYSCYSSGSSKCRGRLHEVIGANKVGVGDSGGGARGSAQSEQRPSQTPNATPNRTAPQVQAPSVLGNKRPRQIRVDQTLGSLVQIQRLGFAGSQLARAKYIRKAVAHPACLCTCPDLPRFPSQHHNIRIASFDPRSNRLEILYNRILPAITMPPKKSTAASTKKAVAAAPAHGSYIGM